MRRVLIGLSSVLVLGCALLSASPKPRLAAPVKQASRSDFTIADGEQRYRANCSRCHQAPPKFAPAAMGTVIRHMRVRAMITDDDMHAILNFMTQ